MRVDRFLIPPDSITLDTTFVLSNPVRSSQPREDGYHIAAICKNIAIRLGLLQWEETDPWEDAASRSSFIVNWGMYMGLIWEAAIMQSIPGVVWQPTPGAYVELSGHKVFGNPDGITSGKWLDGEERVIGHECKYTKSSARMDFGTMRVWHWQVMFYGQPEILDTRFWIFHVMHVNGEYEKSRFGGEQYVQYWVEFTEAEMQGIRRMVESYLQEDKVRAHRSGDARSLF